VSDQTASEQELSGLHRGTIFTFYSFKGGAGRSMALANVAILLVRAGRKVLLIDWDLEAPGLHRFFDSAHCKLETTGTNRPGIVDLILARNDGTAIDWHDCIYTPLVEGSKNGLALLTAGDLGNGYNEKLQRLNWEDLFDKKDLGVYLEDLRSSWIQEYDFVLVDSRTGVSDVGGICTVLLPDVVIALFTSTRQSVSGTLSTISWARERRALLPVDRARLLVVPVPSRDEGQAEHKRTLQWREIYAREFAEIYSDWIPKVMKPLDMVNRLYIPYVAVWSFGEALPVVEEDSERPDPRSITAAYKTLSRLIQAKLNWLDIDAQASLELELTKQMLVAERKKWRRTMLLFLLGLVIAFAVAICLLILRLTAIKSEEADVRSRAAVEESQALVTKLLSATDATAADELLEQFKEFAGDKSAAYLAQEERVANLLKEKGDYVRAGNHFAHLFATQSDPAQKTRLAINTADMYLAGRFPKYAVSKYEYAIEHTEKVSDELDAHFVQAKLLAEADVTRAKATLEGCSKKIGQERLHSSLVTLTTYTYTYPVQRTTLVDVFAYLAADYEFSHKEPGANFWQAYSAAASAAGDSETVEKLKQKVAPTDQPKGKP
jgi:MinD-like ATPase involved in chromosome partitioning or flagellar assembly/uncharacterized surface protein with fasciclin (FAS1) repeats